jgi:hypothetical protein
VKLSISFVQGICGCSLQGPGLFNLMVISHTNSYKLIGGLFGDL